MNLFMECSVLFSMIHKLNISYQPYHYNKSLFHRTPDYTRQETLWFVGVQARAGPYLIGIRLAYFMHKTKDTKLNLSPIWVFIGWLLCLIILAAIVFGPMNLINPEKEEKIVSSSLYASIPRTAWGIALGWIVFACHRGYGGFINLFLSHAYWQPLAKLSFSMYLHGTIIQAITWRFMRHPEYFSDYVYVRETILYSRFINITKIGITFYRRINFGEILDLHLQLAYFFALHSKCRFHILKNFYSKVIANQALNQFFQQQMQCQLIMRRKPK